MAPKKKVDGRRRKDSNNTTQEKSLVKKTARKTGERSSDDIIYSVDNSDSFTMMNIDKDAIPLFDTSDGDTSPSNNTTTSTESLSQGNSDTAITRRRKSSLQKPLKIPRTRSRSKREDKSDGITRAARSKNRDDKQFEDIKTQPEAKELEENATQDNSKTSSDCKVKESDEKEIENSSSVSDIIYHKNEYNDEKTCSDPKPLLAKKTITYNKQNRKENRAWTEEEKTRLLESFESNKKYVDKWVRIKNECGFENRTKAQLQDKYRQITKTSHYYKADRREFVLVDENNKIVTNLMGGCKTFKERWPYDAAKRVVKYYNLKVGDTVIIADYDKLKSIHKYVVVTNEDNVIRLNALEAQYNH